MILDKKVIEEFLAEIVVNEKIPKIIALKLSNYITETYEINEDTIIKAIEEGFE